jgi:hypothetical protein
MKPTLEDGLRALAAAAEEAKSIRVELDEAYLRGIAEVEALPDNQSGVDKSGQWPGGRRYWARVFARVEGPFKPQQP